MSCGAGTVPHLQQVVFLYYPYIYKSVFGRFLLLQLSKSTSVMALNYLLVLLDVIGRLASRNADMMLLRLMYGRRPAQVCWLDACTQCMHTTLQALMLRPSESTSGPLAGP